MQKLCENCDIYLNNLSKSNCTMCSHFSNWRPYTIHSEIMKQLGIGNWYRIFDHTSLDDQHFGYIDPVMKTHPKVFLEVRCIHGIFYGIPEDQE